jgi:hypothetical protein
LLKRGKRIEIENYIEQKFKIQKQQQPFLQNIGTSTAKQRKNNTRKNIPNKATDAQTRQH